jgi:hypothetical protein
MKRQDQISSTLNNEHIGQHSPIQAPAVARPRETDGHLSHTKTRPARRTFEKYLTYPSRLQMHET